MQNRYYLDGKDLFTDYGITVLSSKGELNIPEPKERFSMDWPEDHGMDVDTEENYVQPNKIELECMLSGGTALECLQFLKSFREKLYSPGLKQLITYKDSPKAHMVMLSGGITIERFDQGKVLLFKIVFEEPIPHGKQYIVQGPATIQYQFLTMYPLDIYWGDGTYDLRVLEGPSQNKEFGEGTFTVVVSGPVEKADVYDFSNFQEIEL